MAFRFPGQIPSIQCPPGTLARLCLSLQYILVGQAPRTGRGGPEHQHSWQRVWLCRLRAFTSSAQSPRSISTNTDGVCEWKPKRCGWGELERSGGFLEGLPALGQPGLHHHWDHPTVAVLSGGS